MRTPWIWSVSLGRWWNVHVRLHLFFFLFALFAIYLTSSNFSEPNWLGVVCCVALFVSVLLHEIGHVVVARRLGGVAEEIVLAPAGGLSPARVPYEPHAELVVLMAGTLVNAAICFICGVALAFVGTETQLVDLLRPTIDFLEPGKPLDEESVLQLVFWINWSLVLVNLIPAFPFDGGRSLHAVTSFFWPDADARRALGVVCRLGKVIAVILLVLAWFTFEPSPMGGAQPPRWLIFALLSIYVYFNSRREEMQQAESEHEDDTVFGYDFSQGYTSLERSLVDDDEMNEAHNQPPRPSIFSRWMEKRRLAREERERVQELEDERRVDEVLEQLHTHGMRSLSPDDRSLLDRVSKRYRSRQS